MQSETNRLNSSWTTTRNQLFLDDHLDMYNLRKYPSFEDRKVLEIMTLSITKENGRFVILQPWKEIPLKLPNNWFIVDRMSFIVSRPKISKRPAIFRWSTSVLDILKRGEEMDWYSIRDVGQTKAHGLHSGRSERLGLSWTLLMWENETNQYRRGIGIKWSEWAKRGLLFSSTSARGGPTFETPKFHNVYLKWESKCSVKVG